MQQICALNQACCVFTTCTFALVNAVGRISSWQRHTYPFHQFFLVGKKKKNLDTTFIETMCQVQIGLLKKSASVKMSVGLRSLQYIYVLFILMTGCSGQFTHTSTFLGTLKLTEKTLQWPCTRFENI